MSCRCNIENINNFMLLSQYHAKPYIRFISIHSKNNQIYIPDGDSYNSLLLYPYLKSDTGYLTIISADFISPNLIEIPYIHCYSLTIGSGKYTSLPAPNDETGEQLVYNSLNINTAKDYYYNSPFLSALDVLPVPDSGIEYQTITVQPNYSPLSCLTVADLSRLSVNYNSGDQDNYDSTI